jgi:hypothetical protein
LSATQAYSPAKDTEESLPALLSGAPVTGARFDESGQLWLRGTGGKSYAFGKGDTVFTQLPDGPDSASILGYYHPYCRLIPGVGDCQSFFLGNAGRWFDGIAFFSSTAMSTLRWVPGVPTHLPESVLSLFDPMYRVSKGMALALPQVLARDDRALVFVHSNVPHYPATYAQRSFGLPVDPNDAISYRDNLRQVDHLIGQIVSSLQARAGRDVLLLVSSDHWHRASSPTQARAIPFLAWHVGEQLPTSLSQPINTVHSAELVLDFLNGKVITQAQIARWWQGKPMSPSWIPDNLKF